MKNIIVASFCYVPQVPSLGDLRHFNEEGGWKRMCEAVERYAEQKAEKARLNNLLDNVKNLMESMKWSAEQAMAAMKVSDADRIILQKQL